MTPMMEQYFEIKNNYKEHILFYRLGDFYEMFFDDAILASRELDLTLTGRDCGEAERAPMCGVPFHSSEGYIGKLITKGYKVAICEQTEDVSVSKGLVKREVVRIVTPGTLIETNLLSEKQNNFICALYRGEFESGICFADVSTAQINVTLFCGEDAETKLINEIGTYRPSELLTNLRSDKLHNICEFASLRVGAIITDNQSQRYEYNKALELFKKQFSLDIVNEYQNNHTIISVTGALLSYIGDMQKNDISYIKELNVYSEGQYLDMDINTRRNLELCETMRSKEKRGSLLWVLDKTQSSAGARMLRNWLEHPLKSMSVIRKRQGTVAELYSNYMLREEIGDLLSKVLDLERLTTKVVFATANGKDLRAICSTISILPELYELLQKCESPEFLKIMSEFDLLSDIHKQIEDSINEDAPFSVREGGIIKEGFDKDIDYLRSVMTDGKGWLNEIADKEREASGIKTLKIGYNKVFGYYIEITKSLISQVPERYIRKQTLSNCERYITEELKDMESTILTASDKLTSLEYDAFQKIRADIASKSARIQKIAALLATIDCYYSLATVAARNRYVKPEVDISDVIYIKDGRHPVVEQFVKDTYFVPNDTDINTSTNKIMLITGPNMAGKSTYMRQVALITLMAQIGSFVPASEARIGIVDKIFTRVGASDDLASGQSTFMLEMNEVAYILKNATKSSLIIYDEVGRGTSTFDGMSIARAIIEYTYGKKIGSKTLFATHYHELTSLEDEFEGIVNYNIAAKKRDDSITFLRKIVRGSTDDSYGIEVAKLAGVPNEVIKRAKEVLRIVEQTSKEIKTSTNVEVLKDEIEITFEDCINEKIIEQIKAVDINTLSPYEAMNFLFDLKKQLL